MALDKFSKCIIGTVTELSRDQIYTSPSEKFVLLAISEARIKTLSEFAEVRSAKFPARKIYGVIKGKMQK